ncbi:MAG: glutamine-hydrolyzing carbamoyl-phosphate synthase small subunit [Chloroflexi bacterium]|nr:glutamine-hydrolyzing carbamoyl-phosphate synthase small subunit [Chloroflexota bacterium]
MFDPPGFQALLVLADGSVFRGTGFGAPGHTSGEVVFNTGMTGYQEVLTDPSYAGQIVTMTYPLIGNYGINDADDESRRIQVRGFVVREVCPQPSHWQSSRTLDVHLANNGIVGIAGLDTRALTRRIRTHGVLLGTITTDETAPAALERLRSEPGYEGVDFVQTVTTGAPYPWTPGDGPGEAERPLIVVVDTGLKYNILRMLRARGCRVLAVPATTSADDILAMRPAGVMLSPGPGDPALLDLLVGNVRQIMGRVPLMGICLGNQITARALGGATYKLPFGHRGANHPVKDLLGVRRWGGATRCPARTLRVRCG